MNYEKMNLESVYENCTKPGRYSGGEYNSTIKDWNKTALHAVMAFPDTYEIGSSGLGPKILLGLLNNRDDILVERVYAPWVDYERKLREEKIPLSTIESSRPLIDFDFIGFTLPYEMCYTNVLNMLSLAGIPLLSADRGEHHPLIIGGGSCCYNAEPVADFFDFFLLGEGEEAIIEIADLIIECKYQNLSKTEILEKAALIKGVYVPSLYDVQYDDKGDFQKLIRKKESYPEFIEKRTVVSLEEAYFPVNPPVPYIETVHDRIMMEISRGCTRGCRFCQAGMIYRPVRERITEKILSLVQEAVAKTGYEEISLMSLSCTDHNQISRIVSKLLENYEDRYIEISLPSLRIDSFSIDLARLVQRFRKTSLTLAPEVGTDKMRLLVNKGGSEEEVLSALKAVKDAGWSSAKLYFLTGLPGEEQEDIIGIKDLIWKILQQTALKLTISFSSFVPKPHTPFQWDGFVSIDETKKRQAKLKSLLKHGKITSNFHSPELSFMEAVFSRGDRKLSTVLIKAREKGCRFDGWNDFFDFSKWLEAFSECGIDPEKYTLELPISASLPWQHLYNPKFHEFLLSERRKAFEGVLTDDCRSICNDCGICKEGLKPQLSPQFIEKVVVPEGMPECTDKPVQNIRIKYAKNKEVRLTGHLDMLRAFHRIVRRAAIPAAYTCGFHPRMKFSPGPAIALGITSRSEWADLQLRERLPINEIQNRLKNAVDSGIEILEVREIPLNAKTVNEIAVGASYNFTPEKFDSKKAEEIVENLLKRDEITTERKGKVYNVRPWINEITVNDFGFTLDTNITLQGTIKPDEFISLIESSGAAGGRWKIEKEKLYSLKGDEKIEPWE